MTPEQAIQKSVFMARQVMGEMEKEQDKKIAAMEKKLDALQLRRLQEVRQSLAVQPFTGNPDTEQRIDMAGGTPHPRYGALNGAIDGANAVFQTSANYSPGTLAVYWQGQTLFHGAGMTELLDSDRSFSLDVAPASGQVVVSRYFKA